MRAILIFAGAAVLFAWLAILLKKKEKPRSVSEAVKYTKQPPGGYLPLRRFECIKEGEGEERLYKYESLPAYRIGMVVDYMTKVMSGTPKEKVFRIAMKQAKASGYSFSAQKTLSHIKGLDDTSIRSAAELCAYEAKAYGDIKKIRSDKSYVSDETVCNIRKMVYRSLGMLKKYGGCIFSGFTFEGGYTKKIAYGEGDFLTPDTLWDFKTYKSPLNSQNTLQILIYWRLGMHSRYKTYQKMRYIGLYNPRTNTSYRIATKDIPKDVIETIDHEIIGYRKEAGFGHIKK